jgi:hypothetical protein
MKRPPFKSPVAEAEAIERLVQTDFAKKVKTCDAMRLAKFKSDGMKAAIELRLSTCSHAYSPHGTTH